MSSDITSPHSISQLEFPTPERLLPVGPQRDFSSLVDRVRQALDISDIEGLYALILEFSITNVHVCVCIVRNVFQICYKQILQNISLLDTNKSNKNEKHDTRDLVLTKQDSGTSENIVRIYF